MMKAVGSTRPLPVTDPAALIDLELPKPKASGRDLLVRVMAVSVNPVDVKMRAWTTPPEGQPLILGYDAAGLVEAVGKDVTLFKPGDAVFYAGTKFRPGTNAEYHLVDERIVGKKPASLDFTAAAALPLTSLTAWELLFDRLEVVPGKRVGGTLLIVGAAGGVGSILIQLARRLTGLTVIATASRPETRGWCLELGAHHVIDHRQPLHEELKKAGLPQPNLVTSLNHTGEHFPAIVEALAPQGKLALIDDPDLFDVRLLKPKAASLHWESMFARALFETPDMIAQHRILNDVAALVDDGVLRTTLTQPMGRIDAATLLRAHRAVESGTSRGKIVLTGF